MSVKYNISGTTCPSFTIGKRGATIYHGTSIPDNQNGIDGDIYMRSGINAGLYQKMAGVWNLIQTNNSNIQSLSDIIHSPNATLGSDGSSYVLRTPSQARTALGLGSVSLLDAGTTSGNVPVLDGNGKLPTGVIPALAISEVFVVADIQARDALTAQTGDFAVVSSTNSNFLFNGTQWIEITKPDAVSSVAGKSGTVTIVASDILSGVFPVTRGGTGLSSFSAGDLLVASDSTTLSSLAIGSDHKVLKSSSGAPIWSTLQADEVSFNPDIIQRLSSTNVQDAISELAFERSYTHVATFSPNYSHDGVDTASIGVRFKAGDAWLNSTTNTFYFCGSAVTNTAVWVMATNAGLLNIVEDITPQLGGDLDINGRKIVSSNNSNIELSPNGSGQIILAGNYIPNSIGGLGQILKSDGMGNLLWASDAGEANIASSLGSSADGSSLVGTKTGVSLNFLRIKAGSNISIDESSNSLTINSSDPTSGMNLGVGGAAVFSGKAGSQFQFRRLVQGANVTLTEGMNDITVAVSGLAGVATSGSYTDLANVPSLASVALSGAYSDLSGKPSLGTASGKNTGTLAGNVPVLDSNGKLDSSVLPALSITDVHVVANNTERDALTVQSGDVAKVTSTGKTFINDGSSWVEISAPDAVESVNGLTGVVVIGASSINSNRTSVNYTVTTNDVKAHLDGIDLELGAKATTASLASVATSGDYTDLSNRPTLFSGSYADLVNKPTLFSGSYADLTNKPVLFSGAWSDLTGRPTLGTAASTNIGIQAGNVPVLDSNGKLDKTIVDASVFGNVAIITSGDTINLDGGNHLVIVNKTIGSATTINLPDGTTIPTGKHFVIKDGKGDSSSNVITIDGFLDQEIDGQAFQYISDSYESITIVWNGNQWNII